MKGKSDFPVDPSGILLVLVIGYLVATWLLVLAVDFFNVFDLQRVLVESNERVPLLWWVLFREAGATEWLQRLVLIAGMFATLLIRRDALHRSEGRARLAFSVLTAGLFVMFVEEAFNFRHIVGETWLAPGENMTHPVRIVWELTFYSLLGMAMVVPVAWLYLTGRIRRLPTVRLLGIGYMLYGMAAVASATRHVSDWYRQVGDWLVERLGILTLPGWEVAASGAEQARQVDPDFYWTPGFLLMDAFLEESLELLAAGLLVAGFFRLYGDRTGRPARPG